MSYQITRQEINILLGGDFVAVDKKGKQFRLVFVREQMDAMRAVLRLNIGAILYTRIPLQKPKRKCVS